LVRLIYWLMLSKQPLVGEKEEQPQRVQRFSFVELPFERSCYPNQIIPSTQDQFLVDRSLEQGFDMSIGLGAIHPVEVLLPQVTNTRRKL
jgi:hypothetical protein